MRFAPYLTDRGITFAEAARQLGRHPEVVRQWAHGMALPRKRDVEAIYEWSGGVVAPDDWYNLPNLDEPEAARAAGRDSGAAA